MRSIRQIALVALAFAILGAGAEAFAKDDKYVSVGGVGDGSSWANALGSIQDAINIAGPLDAVYVTSGTFFEAITLDSQTKVLGGYQGGEDLPGLRDVTSYATTIDGSTSGEGGGPVAHVVTMDHITAALLDGFTIRGGVANDTTPSFGGGLFCKELDSSNTIINCTIQGNNADYGGGVFFVNSSPVFSSCKILENSANFGGGGIYIKTDSNPTLTDCTIQDNTAAKEGGGIRVWDSGPVFINCLIKANSVVDFSDFGGGGVYCNYTSATFSNSRFLDNTSAANGAGLFCDHSDITIRACTFTDNEASRKGGGAYFFESNPELSNCAFSDNLANRGGGIYCDSFSDAQLTDCSFENNSAGDGGGVYLNLQSNSLFDSCTFTGHWAIRGGGVFCWQAGPTFKDCIINGNLAVNQGGGAYCFTNSNPAFLGCAIDYNKSLGDGGGVYCNESQATFTNSTLNGNFAAGQGGGAFCFLNTTALFTKCLINGNEAGDKGGGVYCSGCQPKFRSCSISANLSQGVFCFEASPTLINCTISANSMQGVYCLDGSTARLLHCTISSNSANRGSGVYCWFSNPVITNTIFENNSGYAIYERTADTHPLVTYCLFHNNPDGDYFDEGVFFYFGAEEINAAVADASNNFDGDPRFAMFGNAATSGTWSAPPSYDAATSLTTLVDSAAAFTAGGLVGSLINCDVRQQRQVLIVDNTTQTLKVLGDVTGYVDQVDEYRLVDYRLSDGSAAIDQGTNSTHIAYDFDLNWRPVDIPGIGAERTFKEYDIGAFELQYFTPLAKVRVLWQLFK